MRTRPNKLQFYLSNEELSLLDNKASFAGLSRVELFRRFVRDCEIKVPPSLDFLNYHRELRRIGSNIEQLLRLANSKHLIDVPRLRKALDELHKTQSKLWNEFARRDT